MTDYKQTRDAAGKVEDYEKIIEELEAESAKYKHDADLRAELVKAKGDLSAVEGWTNSLEIKEFASTTIAELTSSEAADNEVKGGKDE